MPTQDPKLAEMLDGAAPAPRDDFTVACIYFPGFHPTPFMESWFGFGWSEWELARRCRARFPGHRQPIEPAWGYYDESDPAWSAREVEAAADAGIDAWIFDWYWYSGVEILNEALDRGFLNADNRERMKFAVMWANHTWQNVFPAPQAGSPHDLLPIRHSPEDLDRVLDTWSERYFGQPNYWRIEGRCVCSIFLLSSLLQQLEGEVGVGRAVERMRRRAEANGHQLFLTLFTWSPGEAEQAVRLGFDQATTYTSVRPADLADGEATYGYERLMPTHVQTWRMFEERGVPYWPSISQGWDVSARNHPFEPWPPVRWNWPHGAICVGNTPERFGQLCDAARRFIGTQARGPKALVLNAWNEWTEGSVLAPTADQGDAVLRALSAALA